GATSAGPLEPVLIVVGVPARLLPHEASGEPDGPGVVARGPAAWPTGWPTRAGTTHRRAPGSPSHDRRQDAGGAGTGAGFSPRPGRTAARDREGKSHQRIDDQDDIAVAKGVLEEAGHQESGDPGEARTDQRPLLRSVPVEALEDLSA